MTTTAPALATSLTSRVLAATFGLNDYHETKRAALNAQDAFLREVADLTGLTYRRTGDESFQLAGPDFYLSDFLTGSTDSKFQAFDLTPYFADLIGGAAGPDQGKPGDVRLTPGMTVTKAANTLNAALESIRAYAHAVYEINQGRRTLLDRTRANAARLLAVLPEGDQARYYKQDPQQDRDPTRDLVFYPGNGSTTAAYVQVWDNAQMQLSSVPLDLAEQILTLLKNYQKPA